MILNTRIALAILGVFLFADWYGSQLEADSIPAMPERNCLWISDSAIQCRDAFDTKVRYQLVINRGIVRWSQI